MTKLQSALLATAAFALGAVAVSALHAQSNAPYYQVAGINVTDQAGYEASGVDKVRDAIKAAGGKVMAGGYNKAVAIDSDIPAPNRFLILAFSAWRRPNRSNGCFAIAGANPSPRFTGGK
jgi:uncharacterized protein (DUF1330 family)